jgi:8-oxo-dGTP pyrophosphatase MutT (NUDIX family)
VTISFRDMPLSHAGGVVHRDEGGPSEVLLVRARAEPHDWVLPKGHIESGETAAQAAQREVREEAGVEAEPIRFLGDFEFTASDGEGVHVGYFLMRFLQRVPPEENRELRWCSFTEAVTLTPFENAREILRVAETAIRDLRP